MTNTTTAPATTGLILAIDLGKYKSGACAYDRAGATPRFDPFPTSRHAPRKLFDRYRPAVVVIEACALAGWVADLCTECGLPCQVANTASEAWKFQHTKRKTDRDGALRLAPVVIPAKPTRAWRALIAYRQNLVGRRVAVQNRIRALLVGQGLPAPPGHRAWTELGPEGIE
jgi:transposase